MFDSIFLSITLITILAVLFAFLAAHFRQPLLLGYLLAGLVLGPSMLNLLPQTHILSAFSDLGLALLLFIIGMEIDIRRLRTHGLKAFIIGFIQVGATILTGLFLARMFFPAEAGIVLTLALAMSSTLVVVKTLYEMKKLESLYGQVVLGILLAQDVAAVLAIAFLQAGGVLSITAFSTFLLRFLLLTGITLLIGRLVMPFAQRFFSHQTELVFLSAMAFFFALSMLAVTLGLNMSIGAFLAGMLLSTTLSTAEVTGRVKPVKDFFLMIFFALLGAQLTLPRYSPSFIGLIGLLIILTYLIKPAIILIVTRLLGFGPRTAFLSSLSLAQQGEFGLVILGLGVQQGLLGQDAFSLIVFFTLTTMILTAYLIRYDEHAYQWLSRRVILARLNHHEETIYRKPAQHLSNHYIIFGYHELTEALIQALSEENIPLLIVDHNPEKVRELRARGMHAMLLELTNIDGYDHLNIEEALAVVSTIHHPPGNAVLAREVKKRNPHAIVIVIARHTSDVPLLREAGADFVALPLHLSGKEIADILLEARTEQAMLSEVKTELHRVERGIKVIGERERIIEEELEALKEEITHGKTTRARQKKSKTMRKTRQKEKHPREKTGRETSRRTTRNKKK